MFKVLKWAYSLGVKHERERVAALIQAEAVRVGRRESDIFNTFRNDEVPKAKEEELRVQGKVYQAATRLINNLFEPTEYEVSRASLMFPDDK